MKGKIIRPRLMFVAAVSVALCSLACTAARVHYCNSNVVAECGGSQSHNKVQLPGIPFFAKTGVYRRTTAYAVEWLDVELEFLQRAGDKWETVSKRSVRTNSHPSKRIDALWQSVENFHILGRDSEDEVKAVWDVFERMAPTPSVDCSMEVNPPEGCEIPMTPILNTLETSVIVDYNRVLYLNAKAPLFSRASLTQKINADGSLSEASAEIDTTGMAMAIAALLPLKEFLTARYVPTPDFKGPPLKARFELTIVPAGFVYIFTAAAPTFTDDAVSAAIPFDLLSGDFIRRPIAATSEPTDQKN